MPRRARPAGPDTGPRRAVAELYLSAVVIGELTRGIAKMRAGGRRDTLTRWVRGDLPLQFRGRILAFDLAVAQVWGEIMSDRDRRGRPAAILDAQIAATAVHHGLVVATRNVNDFRAIDVALFNPWDAAP